MVVTFFGHKDIAGDISGALEKAITDVIEKYNADMFLVGNQGGFDRLVQVTLKNLCKRYKNINYRIVLAYLPCETVDDNTIVFDGFETVPPRYAISRRNQWMIDKSDVVITYVTHNIGGAAKFKEIAHKKGKTVINIV